MQRESLLIISNSVGGGGAENAMYSLYRELRSQIPTQLIALNKDQTSSKKDEGIPLQKYLLAIYSYHPKKIYNNDEF